MVRHYLLRRMDLRMRPVPYSRKLTRQKSIMPLADGPQVQDVRARRPGFPKSRGVEGAQRYVPNCFLLASLKVLDMKKPSLSLGCGIVLSALALPVFAGKKIATPAFFDAAICKPPYSSRHANDLYDAAEKLGKPDRSSGAAVYRLPAPIKKDGFVAQDIFFADTTIGVLVEGNVAEKLAKRYNLTPEKMNVINMSGYARRLPNSQQNMKELGLISIVALNSSAFKDKTLLACQFVSNEDRKNMELLSVN
jgi:hypothetical protein